MAQNVEDTSEQVFSDCRAVIFVLELDRWKELFDGGLAHVQLLRQNFQENLTVYRIRGKSESTGQIVLNIVLDRDIKYEIAQGTNYHLLKTKTKVYSLTLSQDSNGKEFALVVQTIIRSIQDNTPSSPREAWMPPVVRQQKAPVPQPKLITESLLISPDAGKNSPFFPQPFPKHNSLGTTLPTSSPSFAPASQPAQAQRAGLQHAFQGRIEMLCERLSKAISNGDSQIAVDTVKLIAEQKTQLIIKLKNQKTIIGNCDSDSFSIRVVVEDQETSGVAFEMKVSSRDTIQSLQEEVADRYGFPPKVQKWIIGNKMAKPTETLADLKIKSTGFTCFLYLVSSRNVGLTRGEFEQFKERTENRRTNTSYASMTVPIAGTQSPQSSLNVGTGNQGLSRATSLPSLNTTRESGNASVNTRQERITFRREAQITNASEPIGPVTTEEIPEIPVQREENIPQPARRIPVPAQRVANLPGNPDTQRTLAAAQSIEDIERLLRAMGDSGLPYQLINERIGQEESVVELQGWSCATCTYVNPPTRPGCEVCGSDRPADYVVPQNPRMTEQERLRLQKEQEEMEIFQRTINQQQQEQEVAREMNFRQLVETAQQNLIRNTEEFDCAICFLNVEPGEGVMLRECLHCFCEDCLREHIKNCTDPEVQCPFHDNDFACHFVITAQEIKALLPEEDFNKFLNRSLTTAESQAANSFHCKTPNCPGWCIYEDNSNVFHCPVCQKVNCLTCKAIHHPEMNCKEYQEDLQRRAQNDVAAKQTQHFLEQMIEKGDAMKCPQCAIILLKKDGCDWMRCSMCRLEICWATRGPRWGPMGVGDLSGGCKCRVGGKKCHPNCKNCH